MIVWLVVHVISNDSARMITNTIMNHDQQNIIKNNVYKPNIWSTAIGRIVANSRSISTATPTVYERQQQSRQHRERMEQSLSASSRARSPTSGQQVDNSNRGKHRVAVHRHHLHDLRGLDVDPKGERRVVSRGLRQRCLAELDRDGGLRRHRTHFTWHKFEQN